MEWGSDSCGGTVNTHREREREQERENNNLVCNRMKMTEGEGNTGTQQASHHNTAGKSTAFSGENVNMPRTKRTGVAQCLSLC